MSTKIDTDELKRTRYIMNMFNKWIERFMVNRWLLLIMIGAALVRAIYLAEYATLPDWTQLTVDNYYHHNWARVIASGDVIGDTTYFRAPFYIWCLGLLYSLLGSSLWVGRLFGMLVGLGSILMTYLLGARLWNKKVGLGAAALQTVYPIILYFESELLLDPLFMLLLQVAIYRLLIWIANRTDLNLLWVGLTIGLASITRPTALVMIPLVLFLLIKDARGPKKLIIRATSLAVGLALIIGPVFLRNLVVAGDPVLIASQGGVNFFIGNNDQANGTLAFMPLPYSYNWRISDVTFEAEREMNRPLKPGEVSTYWLTKGIRWILDNPFDFAKNFAAKAYYHIGNTEIANNRTLAVFFDRIWLLKYNPLSFGLLFTFAVIGMIDKRCRSNNVVTTCGIIFLFIFTGSLFFFSSRFRLPLLPFFILFAAVGVRTIYSTMRNDIRRLSRFVIVGVLAGAISFIPIVSYPQSSSVVYFLRQAGLHYAAGDYVRAIEIGRHALQVDSTFPDVHLNLGAAFFRRSNFDSAKYYFEQEILLHPKRVKAYGNLASLLLESKQHQAAIGVLETALSIRPLDITNNLLRLRVLRADTSLSTESLVTLIAQAAFLPGQSLSFLNEAGAVLIDQGGLETADSIFSYAKTLVPPPVETDDFLFRENFPHFPEQYQKLQSRTHYHLGLLGGIRNKFEFAIEANQTAIKLDSTLVEAYINLIAAYVSAGHIEMADSVLTEATARFPDHELIQKINQLRGK